MYKVIAILQILSVFTSNIGVNVYLHYCHSTNSVVVALSADAATCKDHVCCEHSHTNSSHINSHICCDNSSENNNIAFRDLECCQNAEKYLALSEKSLQSSNSSVNIFNFIHKIDYDLPFYFDVIFPDINFSEGFDFYKYLKQKIIFSSIYFSSNLV